MNRYLTDQIQKRRSRLVQLEREKLATQAELRAYEDMLAHLNEEGRVSGEVPEVGASSNSPAEVAAAVNALSAGWSSLLRAMVSRGTAFNTRRVMDAAKTAGIETTEVNVRSQLSIYVGKGILDRVGTGLYTVTEPAVAALISEQFKGLEDSASPSMDGLLKDI